GIRRAERQDVDLLDLEGAGAGTGMIDGVPEGDGEIGRTLMDEGHDLDRCADDFSKRGVAFEVIGDELGKPAADRKLGHAGAAGRDGELLLSERRSAYGQCASEGAKLDKFHRFPPCAGPDIKYVSSRHNFSRT